MKIFDSKEIHKQRNNKVIKLKENEEKINIAFKNKNKYVSELDILEHEKIDLEKSIFYDNIYLGLYYYNYSIVENENEDK